MISMLLLFSRAWSAQDLFLLSLLNLRLWQDFTHLPTQLGVLGQNKRIAKLGNPASWQQSAVESCNTSQKQYFPQNSFHSWATCGFKIFLNQDIISGQYCFCSFAELSDWFFFWTSVSRTEILGVHNILEVDRVLRSCTPHYVKKPYVIWINLSIPAAPSISLCVPVSCLVSSCGVLFCSFVSGQNKGNSWPREVLLLRYFKLCL